MSIRTSKALLIAGVAIAVASPALARKKHPEISYAPTLPAAAPAAPVANGAIFQASAGYAALFEGNRARHIGDMITILLVEQTVAQKVAGSTTGVSGVGRTNT